MIGANTEKVAFNRSVYSGLDLLGDIGGLYGILHLLANFFVNYSNVGSLFNFIVTKLYFDMPPGSFQALRQDSLSERTFNALQDASSLKLMRRVPISFMLLKGWLCCRMCRKKREQVDLA